MQTTLSGCAHFSGDPHDTRRDRAREAAAKSEGLCPYCPGSRLQSLVLGPFCNCCRWFWLTPKRPGRQFAAVALLALVLVGCTTPSFVGQASAAAGSGLLPNHRLTPGVVDQRAPLSVICSTSTTTRRHTSAALKRRVYASYGIVSHPAGSYEVDHLIPLEIGGADVQANLWPEAAPSFHRKDHLENRLHALVCAHRMPLAVAQHDVAANWVVLANRLGVR